MDVGMTHKTVLTQKELEEFNLEIEAKLLGILFSTESFEDMTIRQVKEFSDKIRIIAWNAAQGIMR